MTRETPSQQYEGGGGRDNKKEPPKNQLIMDATWAIGRNSAVHLPTVPQNLIMEI